MPECVKCGKKVLGMDLDRNGVCRQCIDARADKGSAVRTENLEVCRRRCAKPNIQRIFDGFTAKYPDALLTGISVQEGGDKLLIYLDEKPMYYATFNPLTNSVDLVSHQEVQARLAAAKEKNAKEAAEANKQKELAQNSGCAVWLSVFGIFYGLFCILFSTIGGAIGMICSLLVIAGGLAKSRSLVIVGGALSISAALFGFPFTIGYILFGIFYICAGTSM